MDLSNGSTDFVSDAAVIRTSKSLSNDTTDSKLQLDSLEMHCGEVQSTEDAQNCSVVADDTAANTSMAFESTFWPLSKEPSMDLSTSSEAGDCKSLSLAASEKMAEMETNSSSTKLPTYVSSNSRTEHEGGYHRIAEVDGTSSSSDSCKPFQVSTPSDPKANKGASDTNCNGPAETLIQSEHSHKISSVQGKTYRNVVGYSSSEEDDEEDGDSTNSEDSSSSSISSSSDDSSSDDSSSECSEIKQKERSRQTKDLTVNDLFGYGLPAIGNLKITVLTEEIQHCANIKSIINSYSTIVLQSVKGVSVLHFDTVLFLEDGESIGTICEVFGKVEDAHYTISISKKDIAKKKLFVGMKVFYAPEKKNITKFVFTEDLIATKGSDASWLDNQEPPDGMLEYSDDEEERLAKAKKKLQRRAMAETGQDSSVEQPEKKRDKRYDERICSAGSSINVDIDDGTQSTRWRPRFQANTFSSLPPAGSSCPSAFGNRPSFPQTFYSHSPSTFEPHAPLLDNQGWPPMSTPPTAHGFNGMSKGEQRWPLSLVPSLDFGRANPPSNPGHFPPGTFCVPPPPIFGAPPYQHRTPPPPPPPPTTIIGNVIAYNFPFSSPTPPPPPPTIDPSYPANANGSVKPYNFLFSTPPPPPLLPHVPTQQSQQNINHDQSLKLLFSSPPPPPPPLPSELD